MFFVKNYQVNVLRDSNYFPESPELKKAYNEYCDKKEKESLDYLRTNYTIGNFKLIEFFAVILEKYLRGEMRAKRLKEMLEKKYVNKDYKYVCHFTNYDEEGNLSFTLEIRKDNTNDIIEKIHVDTNLNNSSLKTACPTIKLNIKWECYVDYVSFIEQMSVDHKKV